MSIPKLIITALLLFGGFTTYSLAQTEEEPVAPAESATPAGADTAVPVEASKVAPDISASSQLIADANPKEAVWLDTSEGKWLAFYKITESKENKGVLLMIHASEQPERWPAALELLRRHLPLFGWETFALAVPAERITDNTIAELLQAAIAHLQQNGKYNLVLLSDNQLLNPTTTHLLPQIKPNPQDPKTVDGPIQAMILLNMQAQYPLTQEMLEASFANPDLPVMDIFFNPPNVTQENDQRLHKTTAARKKLLKYRQQTFPWPEENTLNENKQFWISAVRGFMDTEAKGTEVR